LERNGQRNKHSIDNNILIQDGKQREQAKESAENGQREIQDVLCDKRRIVWLGNDVLDGDSERIDGLSSIKPGDNDNLAGKEE
jgi:hypothetical protein